MSLMCDQQGGLSENYLQRGPENEQSKLNSTTATIEVDLLCINSFSVQKMFLFISQIVNFTSSFCHSVLTIILLKVTSTLIIITLNKTVSIVNTLWSTLVCWFLSKCLCWQKNIIVCKYNYLFLTLFIPICPVLST